MRSCSCGGYLRLGRNPHALATRLTTRSCGVASSRRTSRRRRWLSLAAAVLAAENAFLAAVRDRAPQRHARPRIRAGRGYPARGPARGLFPRLEPHTYTPIPTWPAAARAARAGHSGWACCPTPCGRAGARAGLQAGRCARADRRGPSTAARSRGPSRSGGVPRRDGRGVGVTDPASCVFVGDRPFDDIFGAKSLGMRNVLIPNSLVPAHEGTVPER